MNALRLETFFITDIVSSNESFQNRWPVGPQSPVPNTRFLAPVHKVYDWPEQGFIAAFRDDLTSFPLEEF
jgi:hypothetical protein